MNRFEGLAALRKHIELILQKLNKYEERMNEISREELIEIMANENLDLSWIASQESVNELKMEVNTIKNLINQINRNTMKTIGTAADKDYFSATISGSYLLLHGMNTSLPYTGDAIVYQQYPAGSNNTNYSTKIAGNTSYPTVHFTKCTTLTIQDNVVIDGSKIAPSGNYGSVLGDGALANLCKNNQVITDVTIGRCICSKIKYASRMFSGCANLINVQIGELRMTESDSVVDEMFNGCSSLTKLDIRNFDMSNVTSANRMFQGCTNLTEILVKRDGWVSDSCTATDMFKDCGVDHVTYVD